MTKAQLLARIDDLLVASRGAGKDAADTFQAFTGAMTLMTSLYGTKSPQVEALIRRRDELQSRTQGTPHVWDRFVRESVEGALENLRKEVEADLLPSMDKRITSGVLADFVGLAREALAQPGDGSKNVAAVLAAAAYEDTLRRIAGAGPDKKLAMVIDDLKKSAVLVQPQLGIAQSFLKFRNQALHAEWDTIGARVRRERAGSCSGSAAEALRRRHGVNGCVSPVAPQSHSWSSEGSAANGNCSVRSLTLGARL